MTRTSMRRTKPSNSLTKRQKIRKDMITNIMSCNNVHTVGTLSGKNDSMLLANCHPIDRIDFARRLYNAKQISYDEMKKCSTNKNSPSCRT